MASRKPSAKAAEDDDEYDDTPHVMFIVGRMNPPTPGHINGLCIPFLNSLRKKAIRVLGDEVPVKKNVRELLITANIIPKIYLTLTNNDVKIAKLSVKQQAKYTPGIVRSLTVTKPTKATPLAEGKIYVKDENLQNPLEPDEKRKFVVKMLIKAMLEEEEMTRDMGAKELVDYVEAMVVCGKDKTEYNCSVSLYTAINCARDLNSSRGKDYLTIFMGSDEVDERKTICGKMVNCEGINRTFSKASGRKMSGSLIRSYAASENYPAIYTEYRGLLEDEDIGELIYLLRKGMRMIHPDEDDKGGNIKKLFRNKKKSRKRNTSKRGRGKRGTGKRGTSERSIKRRESKASVQRLHNSMLFHDISDLFIKNI